MPSPTAAPPATLVARHLRHERGGLAVLDDVSLTVGPATCLGVVGPNGVGKSTLLQILAGLLDPVGRARSGSTRRPPTVGYLGQEHARAGDETVRRRTASPGRRRRRRRPSSPPPRPRLASGGPGGRRPLRGGPGALRVGVGRGLRGAPASARCAQVALPPEVADQPVATLSGGQEARVALAAVLLARFDVTLLDEPTNDLDFDGLARLEELVARRTGRHGHRLARPRLPRAHRDRRARAGRALPTGSTVRRWLGGVPGRAVRRPVRTPPTPTPSTSPSAGSCAGGPSASGDWATAGVAREKKRPRDNDKAQRKFRIERTENLAARARRTERALRAARGRREAVGGLGPALHHQRGGPLRRRRRAARGCGRRTGRLHARALHAGHRLGRADRARRAQRVGQDDARRGAARPAPARPGTRRMGPSVVVGELAQDRRVLRRLVDPGGGLHRRHRAPAGPGAVTVGQVRPGRGRGAAPVVVALARRAHPGRAGRVRRRSASTSSSSTSRPTISTSRPSNSSSRRSTTTAARSCSSRTTGDCSRRSRRPAAWSCPAWADPTAGCASG